MGKQQVVILASTDYESSFRTAPCSAAGASRTTRLA